MELSNSLNFPIIPAHSGALARFINSLRVVIIVIDHSIPYCMMLESRSIKLVYNCIS